MEPPDGTVPGAADWFRRFTARYNGSAGSPLTELGLFYERHRKFEEYGQRSDPGHPEYTDEEWNRVLEILFGELAGDLGLVQAADSEDRTQLAWYLPGVTDRPTVVIRATSEATPAILSHDLAELSRLGSDLSVFLMYPDYPNPAGATTLAGAVRAWTGQIEERLRELHPPREILTLMISAYSFDLPAPWQGFVWKPAARTLEAAK